MAVNLFLKCFFRALAIYLLVKVVMDIPFIPLHIHEIGMLTQHSSILFILACLIYLIFYVSPLCLWIFSKKLASHICPQSDQAQLSCLKLEGMLPVIVATFGLVMFINIIPHLYADIYFMFHPLPYGSEPAPSRSYYFIARIIQSGLYLYLIFFGKKFIQFIKKC